MTVYVFARMLFCLDRSMLPGEAVEASYVVKAAACRMIRECGLKFELFQESSKRLG